MKRSIGDKHRSMLERGAVYFLLLCCLVDYTKGQTPEELQRYLDEDNCQNYRVSYPEVTLQDKNGLRCGKVTPEEVSTDVYYDNQRLMIGNTTIYTAFQGHLTYHDNTPGYCFDQNKKLASFNMRFDSTTLDSSIRTEFTPCRAGGFFTNGKVLCTPPECSKYLNVPNDMDFFQDELYVTYHMRHLPDSNTTRDVIVTHFTSPKDPRLVYNATSNQTQMLTTSEFFAQCAKFGPCYGGKFLNQSDLLYSWGGFPQLLMKIQQKETFIALRHDPRPHGLIEKQRPRPCMFKLDQDYELCQSPAGQHHWRILWKSPIPYKKEWLSLHWRVLWSYKRDCIIKVTDTESQELLVNYEGPCGRHYDMKLGNYPYPSVGLFSKGIDVPVIMKFKNVQVVRTGPTMASGGIIISGSLWLIIYVIIASNL